MQKTVRQPEKKTGADKGNGVTIRGNPFENKLRDEVRRLEKIYPEVRDAVDLPI